MKPMEMAEALFGGEGNADGVDKMAPEGSVDSSALAAIAAHLKLSLIHI